MRNFCSSQELNEPRLQERDIIKFPQGLSYQVFPNALLCEHDVQNDQIFILLGIEDKYEFCKKYYGYECQGYLISDGQFPLSKKNDFLGLTRVAMALMAIAEEQMKNKIEP